MKISWIDISDRIKFELQQLKEEGSDISKLCEEWNKLQNLYSTHQKFQIESELFYSKLESISTSKNIEKSEPSDWQELVQQCNIKADIIPSFKTDFIKDRILGGWLGRSAGCLLGKPVEKIPRTGMIELLSSNSTWPICDYITALEIPDELLQKYPWNKHSGIESLKENIECMPEDDDMNYPILNLLVFERYGEKFTTDNIIQTWMEMIPVLSTFTAERIAYINCLNNIFPPQTAINRNPYREWIGAQIRADLWGWISPAQPARAAEFAWRDARLTHVRNGIYGEIFFSAALAACFLSDDINEIIYKALSYIPHQSRFSEAIRFVLSLPIQEQPWDETVNSIYQKFGTYHWVHVINNASIVVAALISAKGDFEKAICNAVMGGWDTDSNGATVGSIMGTMVGAKNLPSKWIKPLNDKIRSSLKGFDNSLLSDLAQRTIKMAKYHIIK